MVDAQDKMTGLIRRAIEDKGHLELVTSSGKPTPRGGYDTTWMFAQNGTNTFLTIEAAWYPQSASFTLTGSAVERAEDAFWADRGLIRSRQGAGRGPLQCRLLVPYAGGDRADLLLAVLRGLLAPYHAEKTAESPGGQPSEGEAPTVAHLAARVETAAEALRVVAGAGPLSGESAAAVAGHLQAALDHIAGTLSRAVSDALPHAARHLDVAATRIGLTADLISSAGPVIAATAGRTADFPGEAGPMAPGQGGASPSPAAASRFQTAKPARGGRAR